MPRLRSPLAWTLLAVIVLGVAAFPVIAAIQYVQARQAAEQKIMLLTGGDPHAGRTAIVQFGCGGCHAIPGVPGARGLTGPPLTKWGSRVMIAGKFQNKPTELVRWLKEPQAMDPGVDMPNTGVTDQQARDIAAYLYTLG